MEEASEYSTEVPVSCVSSVPWGSDPEGRRKEGAPVVSAAGVGGHVTKVVPSAPYHSRILGRPVRGTYQDGRHRPAVMRRHDLDLDLESPRR